MESAYMSLNRWTGNENVMIMMIGVCYGILLSRKEKEGLKFGESEYNWKRASKLTWVQKKTSYMYFKYLNRSF